MYGTRPLDMFTNCIYMVFCMIVFIYIKLNVQPQHCVFFILILNKIKMIFFKGKTLTAGHKQKV